MTFQKDSNEENQEFLRFQEPTERLGLIPTLLGSKVNKINPYKCEVSKKDTVKQDQVLIINSHGVQDKNLPV